MIRWLRQSKLGFSLMELFIIIAILGILAAIIIPHFMKYRDRNRWGSLEIIPAVLSIDNRSASMCGRSAPPRVV